MDRVPLLPSVLALAKGVGLILSLAFGSMSVKHGVQKYGQAEAPTNTTVAPAYQVPTVAVLGQGYGPCLTSRFVDANDPNGCGGELFLQPRCASAGTRQPGHRWPDTSLVVELDRMVLRLVIDLGKYMSGRRTYYRMGNLHCREHGPCNTTSHCPYSYYLGRV